MHGQASAMTKSTIAPNVHQTLDVHGGLTTEVTLNGELRDFVADFFQVPIGEVLDFFGVIDATRNANFARASATNAKNSRQTHFRVLVGRNVDASDTCHVRPLKSSSISLDAACDGDLCK